MSEAEGVVTGYHDLVRTDVFGLIPKGKKSILDIGGGIGATSAELKRQGYAERVAVVDIVTEGFLPEVDASYTGDLNDPAFFDEIEAGEGKVDIILCLDVLEHLVDPWTVVAHLHKRLAPGGVIVASLPNMRFWTMSWGLFAKGQFTLTDKGLHDRTHMRWFVHDTARDLMTSSGLELEEMVGKIPGRRWPLFNKLTFGKVRGLFELQYLIRVRLPD